MAKPKKKTNGLTDELQALLRSEAFSRLIDWFEIINNPVRMPPADNATAEERIQYSHRCAEYAKLMKLFRNFNVQAKQESIASTYEPDKPKTK